MLAGYCGTMGGGPASTGYLRERSAAMLALRWCTHATRPLGGGFGFSTDCGLSRRYSSCSSGFMRSNAVRWVSCPLP